MKYLGEDVAKDRGLADVHGYTSGCWVAWNDANNEYVFTIDAVFSGETECLRWAVRTEQSVAFLPYGQEARTYIKGPVASG